MSNREESFRGLMILNRFIRKLQQVVLNLASKELHLKHAENSEEIEAEKVVPNDVKKGHFAVIAVQGRDPKRFILELDYLTYPAFLTLLEQAKEEYGFQQKGVLAVPCQPEDLQRILEERRQKSIAMQL